MNKNGEDLSLAWAYELGPIKELIQDESISEIMVNGVASIFVEREGKLEDTELKFSTAEELNKVVAALARIGGHELSRKSPCSDVLLPDGSRANIVVTPAAVGGPYLTIRRTSKELLDLKNLVKTGFLDQKVLYFLNVCIANRLNILVSGGTSTGKTTLLNALIGMIPQSERLVTIEDTLELRGHHKNLVRLEAKTSSTYVDGISAKVLVRNALRMRPDRIIVGETRGGEAWDIIQAMNSGHEGSLTAVHANHALSALSKLEAFVMMEEEGITSGFVRNHISKIINLVIQVERDAQGHRHISEIIELIDVQDDEILSQVIFSRDSKGELASLGTKPMFLKRKRRKIVKGFPDDFFEASKKVTLEGFN